MTPAGLNDRETSMLEHDIAFELGWEHARHSVCPPTACREDGHPVRLGFEAGRDAFGLRARQATPAAREWLNLRVQAWLRGRCFETLNVTPTYLQHIRNTHCPITRQALTTAREEAPLRPSDAVFSRLCEDAGYAAGHLAHMGALADAVKSGLDLEEAHQTAQALAGTPARMDGLDHAEWARLAVLMSFVTPLPHAQAARLPMRVLPPNRLHLLNPVQGLQAVVTRLLAPRPDAQHAWDLLAQTLRTAAAGADRLAVLIEALHHARNRIAATAPHSAPDLRWALEDAWADGPLTRAWTHWAEALDAASAEQMLDRLVDLGLAGAHVLRHSPEQSTAGWSLDTRGFVERPTPARVHHLPSRVRAAHGTDRHAA